MSRPACQPIVPNWQLVECYAMRGGISEGIITRTNQVLLWSLVAKAGALTMALIQVS